MRLLAPALTLLLGLVTSACRCDGGEAITSFGGGFRVEPGALDFGRVLEGERTRLQVTVVSTSRVLLRIRTVARAPFSTGDELHLPPGGRAVLPVEFDGRAGDHQGLLWLLAGPDWAQVPLRAVGVTPLPCTPSAVCRVSTFDLPSGSCVESAAPAGTSCVSPDQCVVNGRCEAGACVGDRRSCDDNNVCTQDYCSSAFGCFHQVRRCPAPDNPCQAAVCNPASGCGTAPVMNYSLCGTFDCQSGDFCMNGECTPTPTPEGFPCSAPTACQGMGTCQAQECVRPDAGTLPPTFTLPLEAAPPDGEAPALLAQGGSLYAALCGADGGCALNAWTGNGFTLFSQPFADARVRRVLAVTPSGLWVQAEDAFELYDLYEGTLVATAPFDPLVQPGDAGQRWTDAHRYAVSSSGELWATVSWAPAPEGPDGGSDAGVDGGDPDAGEPLDGGATPAAAAEGDAGVGPGDGGLRPSPAAQVLVRVAPADGGVFVHPLDPAGHVAAMDRWDALYLYDPDAGLTRARALDDGGLSLEPWGLPGRAPAIATGPEVVLIGGVDLVSADGGVLLGTLEARGEAGEPVRPLAEPLLLMPQGAFTLYRACAPPHLDPCAEAEKGTWIRRVDVRDGGSTVWGALVMPALMDGAVVELASSDDGVAVLSQRYPDGGLEVRLQGFYDGEEYLSCAIDGQPRLGAAVFHGSYLYTVMGRDAGWALEAFDLAPGTAAESGWSARHGAAGTRRAR